MLRDGSYAAWFKTPLGEGTGIAHVADGKIWGRDSIMSYSGSCETNGDHFMAIVTIKRHTEGHATVFGADDLTLRLEGTCTDRIATYTGTADQVPGVLLEGRLIFSEQQPVTLEPASPIPPLDLARLPKLPKRSR